MALANYSTWETSWGEFSARFAVLPFHPPCPWVAFSVQLFRHVCQLLSGVFRVEGVPNALVNKWGDEGPKDRGHIRGGWVRVADNPLMGGGQACCLWPTLTSILAEFVASPCQWTTPLRRTPSLSLLRQFGGLASRPLPSKTFGCGGVEWSGVEWSGVN